MARKDWINAMSAAQVIFMDGAILTIKVIRFHCKSHTGL